jgi:hypothetical protein
MTVSTSNYEETHGSKPKPSQHGLWIFTIERRPGEYTDFQTSGTYRDALRDAKAEAKQIGGASHIIVQA